MKHRLSFLRVAVAGACVLAALASRPALAATKTVDLDGQAANGAESQCDLNVLQTFPVKIENKVTNKAVGDAYNFSWKSAGPGGFTSSVAPGSAGGVGAKWVWTTNQTVFSYTGGQCANDICFLQTGGTLAPSTCSDACMGDGATLSVSKGGTPGQVVLTWAGGQGAYTVYRSAAAAGLANATNAIATTDLLTLSDQPADPTITYYLVKGTDCATRKPCSSDADCSAPGDGTCTTRGPFGAPGRSLYANDVTVSSASLTSSLITFFSPPKEVFRVTSSVAPGAGGVAYQQTITNATDQSVTTTVAAYPPGCCDEPHQINCDGTCFNYLTDSLNCGGCGVVCPENSYCDNGSCSPACSDGTTLCGTSCFDLQSDRQNCGSCGHVCETILETENCEGSKCYKDQICVAGTCQICEGDYNQACNNVCTDVHTDAHNCGICGANCDLRCPEGTVSNYCNGGGTCCCVQPEGGEVCVPSWDSFTGGFASRQPPVRSSSNRTAEAPICETPETQTIIPPGGTSTDCLVAGVLAKEVPTTVVICGDNIPAGDARCANGDPATQGTFMKLIPDLSKPIGNAFITPFKIHVFEPSYDSLIQPGEAVDLAFEVLNAGPMPILNAQATLLSPPVDLTDDGIENPAGVTVSTDPVSFGTIPGTLPTGDCLTPPELHPARGGNFHVVFPLDHPFDTARPFTLHFTGTVDDLPFVMDVPVAVGVTDVCDVSSGSRGFDKLDGLTPPMPALIPLDEPAWFPPAPFPAGEVRELRLRQYCGGVLLDASNVDPPQITGLSEQTLGPLDITTLGLNNDNVDDPNDPMFHFDPVALKWTFDLRTTQLGPGTFTLTIRLASRKEYHVGFVLVSD